MTRREAISVIADAELAAMKQEDRESLLLDWWTIDHDDHEFCELPELLRAELKRNREPDATWKPQYDSLLRIALRKQFVGVRNEYLSSRLSVLNRPSQVEGAVEMLEQCPCCTFRTLSKPGEYEICKVCFWEDDGSREPDALSDANHMTLREARDNFARLGAVSKKDVANVLRDGPARYKRDADSP